MNETGNFKELSKKGLAKLYYKAEKAKQDSALEQCKNILALADNWERHYNDALYCIKRSFFYGNEIIEKDLSETDKIVFFWKTLEDEIENNWETIQQVFPLNFHCYSEDNFKLLVEYIKGAPVKELFTQRYISYEDICESIKGLKVFRNDNFNLRSFFNALSQDYRIPYSEENLKIIQHWVCHKQYDLYLDNDCILEKEWIEHAYYSFCSRTSELEKRLFYWTALFCDGWSCKYFELDDGMGDFFKNIPGRYLIYNSYNLERLFKIIQRRISHKKKTIIPEEEGYYNW